MVWGTGDSTLLCPACSSDLFRLYLRTRSSALVRHMRKYKCATEYTLNTSAVQARGCWRMSDGRLYTLPSPAPLPHPARHLSILLKWFPVGL